MHLHLFFKQEITNEQREQFIDLLLPRAKPFLDKSYWTKTKQMIALEYAPHFKTGKEKLPYELTQPAVNEFPELNLTMCQLINFCLLNKLPEGERNQSIMPNFMALQPGKELIELMQKTQDMTYSEIGKWKDTELNCKQLKNYFIEKKIPYNCKHCKKPVQKMQNSMIKLLDYRGFAKEFVEKQGIYYDEAQNWWFWNEFKSCWELTDETTVLNAVDGIGFKEDTLDSKVKNKLLEALKREGRKLKPEELPKTCIQFKDKIYNYLTEESFPASREWFALNPIPHALGLEESTPTIDKLFSDWMGAEKSKDLEEIVAFILSSDYFIHRIICLTGSGRNGKSTFLDLIKQFIGRENCCTSDLDLLISSRFEAARLHKKLLCTMGETNFSTISRTSKLKSLTGQDLVGMEFKNKKPFDEVSYAKILIATNSLPETEDKTEGFYRRWKVIEFNQKFEEKADLLIMIPEIEYQNLGLKCCKILKTLRNNCKFSFDGTIEQRRAEYDKHSNPVGQFIKDNYDLDENYSMPFFKFFEQYVEFCSLKGIRELTKTALGLKLKDLGFSVQDRKIKKENGEYASWRFILGFQERIGLRKFYGDSSDSSDSVSHFLATRRQLKEEPSEPSEPSEK